MSRMIEIEGLSKSYGETRALKSVDLSLEAGAIHTVLGENGSGKSTFVKILSGIVLPDTGTIRIDGQTFAGRNPRDFIAKGLATVFQEVLVAPDRSVVDNVLLGMDKLFHRTIRRSERRERAAEAIAKITRMDVPLDAEAGSLPLAARQVVVLARALVRKPRILILDEATAALDHGDRENMFQHVEAMARAGALVVFISHRMDEVMRLSDRIFILRAGELVASLSRGEATPEELLKMMAPESRRVRADA